MYVREYEYLFCRWQHYERLSLVVMSWNVQIKIHGNALVEMTLKAKETNRVIATIPTSLRDEPHTTLEEPLHRES